MKRIVITFFITILAVTAWAQPPKAAEATISLKRIDQSTVELIVNLVPTEGFHIYSFIPSAEKGGPKAFEINVDATPGVEASGKPVSTVAPVNQFDDNFGMKVNFWDKPVILRQRYKITDSSVTNLKGYIRFQGCNGDLCTPPRKQQFDLPVSNK